jgi:hypothetical protein
MSQFGVLVTWRDVASTAPTLALLEERLAPFRLEAVLAGFSRLAAALQTWQNEPSFATDQHFARQFLPTYYPAIKRLCEADRNRVTFTRIGILFVLKHACAVCRDDGREVRTPEDVEQLLSSCLLANDLMLGRSSTPNDSPLDKAASLLPFSNYVPQDTYPTDLVRNLLLFEEIAPQLAGSRDYIDLTVAFRNATGLTTRQFCELTLATSSKFITNVDTQLQNPNTAVLLSPSFYQHTAIPTADVTAFLARLHTTLNELRDEARRPATLGSDFLLFQRHPLVEITGPAYMCPDPGFLLDKGGPGLYWTLHETTPTDERHALSDVLVWPDRTIRSLAVRANLPGGRTLSSVSTV